MHVLSGIVRVVNNYVLLKLLGDAAKVMVWPWNTPDFIWHASCIYQVYFWFHWYFFFIVHFCNVIRTLCFRLTGFLWFTVLSVSVAFDCCFLRRVLQMKAHDIFFPVWNRWCGFLWGWFLWFGLVFSLATLVCALYCSILFVCLWWQLDITDFFFCSASITGLKACDKKEVHSDCVFLYSCIKCWSCSWW